MGALRRQNQFGGIRYELEAIGDKTLQELKAFLNDFDLNSPEVSIIVDPTELKDLGDYNLKVYAITGFENSKSDPIQLNIKIIDPCLKDA